MGEGSEKNSILDNKEIEKYADNFYISLISSNKVGQDERALFHFNEICNTIMY